MSPSVHVILKKQANTPKISKLQHPFMFVDTLPPKTLHFPPWEPWDSYLITFDFLDIVVAGIAFPS